MQHSSKTQSNSDLTSRVLRFADWLLTPRSQPHFPDEADVHRIVVIKPCCLGDMLMATPAMRALNQRFPSASLSVATNQWTQPAIETSPRIDQIIRIPDGRPSSAAIKLGWQLRAFHFDIGVSLDRSPATSLALRLGGIPIRMGIDSGSRGIGLTHRVQPITDQHETELYLSVLDSAGFENLTKFPEYYIPDEAHSGVAGKDSVPQNRRLAIIHPGGAVNPGVEMLEKRWPATSFGELASLLAHETGVVVVLVGTESDRNAVETVKQFARAPVIDLCGQLSMPELAALAQKSSLYVGNDSGTTHLASAVGAPVVAIFGPTSPQRYRPLGRRTRICAPKESWSLPEIGDLRRIDRATLPEIAAVPLPSVFNACLELLDEVA